MNYVKSNFFSKIPNCDEFMWIHGELSTQYWFKFALNAYSSINCAIEVTWRCIYEISCHVVLIIIKLSSHCSSHEELRISSQISKKLTLSNQ